MQPYQFDILKQLNLLPTPKVTPALAEEDADIQDDDLEVFSTDNFNIEQYDVVENVEEAPDQISPFDTLTPPLQIDWKPSSAHKKNFLTVVY